MTTAIRVYSSSGEEGRCDARCHEAREPACDCCCGSRLHGVGSSAVAIGLQSESTFEQLLGEAEIWAKIHGISRPKVKMPGLRGRRSLERLLQPVRVAEHRRRRLGIAPGQLGLWPNPS